MSASLHCVFLDTQDLQSPERLERILQVFLDAGFIAEYLEVQDKRVSPPYPDGKSEILSYAYQKQELTFTAYNPQWRFEIRQQIAWGLQNMGGEHRAWIRSLTDNTPYFWNQSYNPARYSRFFLDLCKGIYEVVQPSFGWIDFDGGLFTTHPDIEGLQLPALYWANFFGPSYVKKLTRDRILNAPAWAIEELVDGGLLYLLGTSPGLSAAHVPIEAVKAYFGVETVR